MIIPALAVPKQAAQEGKAKPAEVDKTNMVSHQGSETAVWSGMVGNDFCTRK